MAKQRLPGRLVSSKNMNAFTCISDTIGIHIQNTTLKSGAWYYPLFKLYTNTVIITIMVQMCVCTETPRHGDLLLVE
jgi:hypothetical protein